MHEQQAASCTKEALIAYITYHQTLPHHITKTQTQKPKPKSNPMAKTGVFDGDPTTTITSLKNELKKLVKSIDNNQNDEGLGFEIDKGIQVLSALKNLKLGHKGSSGINGKGCPVEFMCPLSKDLMRDPVIVSTGQTYDRPFIQRWLKSGNRTCPRTQQVLSHTLLIPNLLIRELISKWCKDQGMSLPDPVQYSNEDGLTEADREHFSSLIEKMSSNLDNQKEAARQVRSLTKKVPSFRALFGESPDKIPKLINPISKTKSFNDIEPNLQEDLITTLLNISIHDSNKKVVAETPNVIPVLINALRSGTIETKSNAAATLFTLSALDSNKALIGKSGALKPLINLIEEENPSPMKDVTSALFNLCIYHENKARAVRDGAVSVILKKITNRLFIDELLAILAVLSTSPRAVEEMGELGAVPCLLGIMRENECARNKENCIAIIYTICYSDRTKWKDLRDEESLYGTISQLAQNGTSRAKRKASGLLERLNRAVNLTHTA